MADTRELFVSTATRVFAERGFYGTSIAAIAEDLPFTKQALLHHFGSKEKLYGEVLKRISARLMHELDAVAERGTSPQAIAVETFLSFYKSAFLHQLETQLLMRELLDNKRRAEASKNWYLTSFLNTLTDRILAVPGTAVGSRHVALAVVYQLLGAINYFVISEATLTQMFGAREFAKLKRRYPDELRTLLCARLGLVETEI